MGSLADPVPLEFVVGLVRGGLVEFLVPKVTRELQGQMDCQGTKASWVLLVLLDKRGRQELEASWDLKEFKVPTGQLECPEFQDIQANLAYKEYRESLGSLGSLVLQGKNLASSA